MFKHPADNHESQPEKRRRAEASSPGQLPLSKTSNKHGIANTPTKTSPPVVTEPTQPPPSTSTTPSATTSATTTATPSATQAPKSTSVVGKDSTEASSEIQMDSNVKAGDSSALKPPQQASSTPLPINGKSSLSNGGNNQAISDSLSSTYDIPSIDDKQVMLPPKRIEKDPAKGMIGDYQTHLDDILWTGVDVAENVHKRKGSDEDQPKKKSVKLTAMVSLNCGTSDEATKVLVTIAKNGLDTRFEVTQEGSES